MLHLHFKSDSVSNLQLDLVDKEKTKYDAKKKAEASLTKSGEF
jgi:hypothetical protein